MEDKTKIVLMRLACGTALLIARALTGMDGTILGVSLFLLGVPVEYAATTKEKDKGYSEGKA